MLGFFAEREGFEPPVHCCTMVFKTTAFDHSAISPADGKSKIILGFFTYLRKKNNKIFRIINRH